MHCPSFIFDMAAGRVASEFLESELGLEGFSVNMLLHSVSATKSIRTVCASCRGDEQFLAEIEVGGKRNHPPCWLRYYRLYYEGRTMRKLKPMFGSIEDPVKVKEWSHEGAAKGFRAFVFGCVQTQCQMHLLAGSWKTRKRASYGRACSK